MEASCSTGARVVAHRGRPSEGGVASDPTHPRCMGGSAIGRGHWPRLGAQARRDRSGHRASHAGGIGGLRRGRGVGSGGELQARLRPGRFSARSGALRRGGSSARRLERNAERRSAHANELCLRLGGGGMERPIRLGWRACFVGPLGPGPNAGCVGTGWTGSKPGAHRNVPADGVSIMISARARGQSGPSSNQVSAGRRLPPRLASRVTPLLSDPHPSVCSRAVTPASTPSVAAAWEPRGTFVVHPCTTRWSSISTSARPASR